MQIVIVTRRGVVLSAPDDLEGLRQIMCAHECQCVLLLGLQIQRTPTAPKEPGRLGIISVAERNLALAVLCRGGGDIERKTILEAF